MGNMARRYMAVFHLF